MGGINAQDFISELIFCLNAKDTVKAKALLQFASDANVDVHLQKRALAELAKGPEDIVFPLLEYLTKLNISNTEVQECLYDLILDKAYGNTKDQAAIPAIINIINTQPKDANIRQAAYEAMERIPSPRTAICLVQGLQDPEESVRMGAARAVDKNLSKPLVAGLKNIIRDKSPEALSSVGALIDTDATNIFNFLMGEESFRELAETHIAEKASPSTRKAFIKNMAAIGQVAFAKKLAAKLTGTYQTDASASMKIVVVDDSKMMLKLYQNKLSRLGLACEIYHRPEDAVKRILSGKTDLVITDLNMPNISGLELTREIRRKFTQTDLPILMITTQSDFVEEKEGDVDVNEALLIKSGINRILHKPFSDNDFKESVFKLLPT
ncbi:MAG: response regulator [Thermodesulfobacteriota bacterium]